MEDVGQVRVAYKANQAGGLVSTLNMPLARLDEWKAQYAKSVAEGQTASEVDVDSAELVLDDYLGDVLTQGRAMDVLMQLGTMIGSGRLVHDQYNGVWWVEMIDVTELEQGGKVH